MKYAVTVKSEGELSALGKKFSVFLEGGELIELIGPLGAGKTTLAKGILRGLGVKAGFSPTFILNASFSVPNNKKIKEVHHLDLYRLNNPKELITLGVQDYIHDKNTVVLIEWANRFPLKNIQAKLTTNIEILKTGRKITFYAHGEKHEKMLKNFMRHRD